VSESSGLVVGEDDVKRCWWGESAPDYRLYHDHEWGFPVADEELLPENFDSVARIAAFV